MKVSILNNSISNIASVEASFKRLGCQVTYINNYLDILETDKLVLPGVGTFKAGMEALERKNFDKAIKERISKNRSTLGICLGMQLLFSSSDESPGVVGLEIFPEKVEKFSSEVRSPHFGWNQVLDDSISDYAYFANSYRVTKTLESENILWCDYGGKFVAGLKKGNLTAYQFHPEISGKFGEKLIKNWIEEIC